MTRLDFISLETSFVHFHSTPSTSCSTCLSHFNKISPYSSSSSSTSPLSASSVSFTSFISLAQPNANLSQLSSSVPTLSGFRNVLSKQNSETFGRSMFTTSGRRNSFSLPPTPSLENSPELPAFASSSGYFKFEPSLPPIPSETTFRKRAFSVPSVPNAAFLAKLGESSNSSSSTSTTTSTTTSTASTSTLPQIPEKPSIEKDPINNMSLHGQFMDFC